MVQNNKLSDNHSCNCNASIFSVISGSFRRHLSKLAQLKQRLEKHSVCVLSPTGKIAINPDDEFIILDSDPIDNPKLLQNSVFAKIRRSTFLVVGNFDGYLGNAAIMEIGFAIALGVPIYSLEPITDPNLAPFCDLLSDVFPDIISFNFDEKKSKLVNSSYCC